MAGALPEFALPQTVRTEPASPIKQTEVLAFVNRVLHREETDISAELRSVVDDLADLHCLRDVDSGQTVTSAQPYVLYPDQALRTEEAIISMQLRDPVSSAWGPVLRPWPGGAADHNQFYANQPMKDTPAFYHPLQVGMADWRILIDPRPACDWQVWIHYYRGHPDSLTTLQFPAEWRRAVQFGTAMEVAASYGLEKSIALWGARYAQEKEKRRILLPQEPAISEF